MVKIDISLRDLDCILAYKIDTTKKLSLMKKLKLLSLLGLSFTDQEEKKYMIRLGLMNKGVKK